MRLGLYGGTFDPVHYAHLLLAETCREAGELDQIWFIPNSRSPHKQETPLTDAKLRTQMLELAISGNPRFQVCLAEIDRGGLSYTVDTLEQLAKTNADDELFLLMGGDSLADFPKWREPARICELATPIVVKRPNAPPPAYDRLAELISPQQLADIRASSVAMPQLDISSTDLRARVAAGQSIRYRTPRAVEKYIETQKLYASRD